MNSITVKDLPGYPAMVMTWQHQVDTKDLKPAFRQITETLQQTPVPLYIVVDLSQNPRLPIVDTVMEALRGPFRHPQLAEWLVLSPNRDARWVGNMLSKATRRDNIRWFTTEDELYAYLNTICS